MDQILIIEDNETIRLGMEKTLKKAGLAVSSAEDGIKGLELLGKIHPQCVVTDLKMEGMDGISVMRRIHKQRPGIPVMIMTAFGTIEKAVEAMKLGAYDFITKPFSPDLLRVKVKQALEIVNLSNERERLYFENEYLRSQTQDRYANRPILGNSEAVKKLHIAINRVAKTDTSVFICGESGTGKELVARAIHENSLRHRQPFIKVNCNALAEGLLESELFGHEKGAFTGAVRRKPGRFELANNGTLFLDEIGDISHNLQLKLLRVLQEQEFERVGGTTTIKVNVRIISATNQDLKAKVERGEFREDLYYRLVIVPIDIAPLRERPEDIPILANAWLKRLNHRLNRGDKRLTHEAIRVMQEYPWPGNIRELENMLEQLYILSENEDLDAANLPIFLKKSASRDKLDVRLGELSLPEILDHVERRLLEEAKEQAAGIKTHMAKILGIKTSALYYKLDKYGLLDAERNSSKP